jgi:predicted nucleic acid-binding protein
MPRVTYDTNVFVDYSLAYFPTGFLMSAVVIQELAAGALDSARLRELEGIRRSYEREQRLLIPNGEDWYLAGRILNSLYRGSAVARRGSRVRISKQDQQRILRDVLIARSARRMNVTIITSNVRDFEMIQPYCAVNVEHPREFFR